MNYYKRYWNESSGEELTDSWGTSTWYFETDELYDVLRQIVVFESGQILKYSMQYLEDEYGALSDQPLDPDEFEEYRIEAAEFEENWNRP